MSDGKNLYTLPVIENGKVRSYYCLVRAIETHCEWMLMREGPESELLSHGICEPDDVVLMLGALQADLALGKKVFEWTRETIH